MKNSKLLLALVGGLALPLGAMAAGPISESPPPLYDVVPIEQAYQQQQMSDRAMRTGAEGSPGVSVFDRLDDNKDGFISMQEADKSATAKRDFNTLDRNMDGKVSHEEWNTGGAQ